MRKTVSAVEARKRFGEVLEGVYYRGDEVVIERAGKPMAVVVSMKEYQAIEARRQRFWELLEKTWEKNKDVPFDVIEAEIAEAVAEVRREMTEEPPA
jgi:prevent-host-death family protein